VRILRLDLLRFGPFTDVSLAFDAGPSGLHIVFGRNEAGKSSALRALRQYFYDIPHNSSDNFLHAHPDMRIGAVLESASGEQLHAIRRKGRAQTLRAADDIEPLDPARLTAMLGGVDETTFSQRFGIDYQELVRGGRAIAQGGGDLGSVLFAAGLGIADLNQIAKRLTEEADVFFKARGSTQRVNKAVTELADARRIIKDAQLPESEWTRHDLALRKSLERNDEIVRALLEKRTEQGRLERLGEALSVIGRREKLRAELPLVADAPLLSADFPERRREATTQLDAARAAERESAEALEQMTTAIENLRVPPSLLEHAGAIQQLKEDLGIHRKALKDRAGLVASRQQLENDARQILLDLGREPRLSEADSLRIGRVERRKIQDLGNQHGALSEAHETAKRTRHERQQKLETTQRQMQALAETRDASELSRAIRQVQQHRDLEVRRDRARLHLEGARRQTQIDLHRLPLWSGTLEDLELLKVPSGETIDRFEAEITKAEGDCDRIQERNTEVSDELSQLDQQIEQLRLQLDVPTEADLSAGRTARDEGWRLVLRAWHENDASTEKADEFIHRFAPSTDLASAYKASVEYADELADRLRREADQVATKTKLIAERNKKAERLDDQVSKLQKAGCKLEQIGAQWRQFWQPLGIEPRTPREMRAWSQQQAALAVAAAESRSQESEFIELENQVVSQRGELSRCLRNLGEPCPGPDETLARMAERCETLADQIQEVHEARNALTRDRDRLLNELAEAGRTVAEKEEQLSRWRQDWSAAIEGLRLGEDIGPTDANSILEAIQELHRKLNGAENLRERIDGIDKDADAFRQATVSLAALAAPDLVQAPTEQSASDLYDRLIAAQKADARLSDLQEQSQREKEKRDKARTRSTQWQATLDVLCREARRESPDQLMEAERLSARRQTLELAIREVEDQLLRLAAGTPVDAFVEQAKHVDADRLSPAVQQLADEIDRLEREQAEVQQTIGQERLELRRMDGSSRAAEAQSRAESLLAGIRNDAEQYVRLRLASTVLQRTMERYRQKNQGPVLDSASRLFGALTLGSFRGLRTDFDEKGGAVLVGVRPNGQILGVEGMSDGTRDQLYLALRLASLETYLTEKEPLPFIVDDILIMFDDDRSLAALRALATLSTRTQVIFFTHHEHLVDLAASNLDAGTVLVHRLDIACPAHARQCVGGASQATADH
jgi:uncharacterized protein YhaN